MQNIQVLNNISSLGLEKFPKDTYKVSTSNDNPDAILVRSAKMHDMEIEKSLKAVGRAGAGINNIPLQKMSDNGVVVFNTPGANANAVKELVISLQIALPTTNPSAFFNDLIVFSVIPNPMTTFFDLFWFLIFLYLSSNFLGETLSFPPVVESILM